MSSFANDHSALADRHFLLPGSTIGIVGGGQLGQMMTLSAKRMGFRVGVLDPTENCPAAQVADFQISAEYSDSEAIAELARRSDVLTYEFENVDAEVLDRLGGATVLPQGTKALRVSQNRFVEKEFLRELGVPVAPYRLVDEPRALRQAVLDMGYPCVLKTIHGGYDGKGQVVLHGDEDMGDAQELAVRQPCVLEKWIPFTKEISVLVAADTDGDVAVFPFAENEHRGGILHTTTAPARVSEDTATAARAAAVAIVSDLDMAGTLAVEMFVNEDGSIVVNEIAPRPHNSGHYTIEACSLSQFDAHIRAVVGWPIPEPTLCRQALMVNILGEHLDGSYGLIADHPDWAFHYYGKVVPAVGRKMGHITVLTDDIDAAAKDVRACGIWEMEA